MKIILKWGQGMPKEVIKGWGKETWIVNSFEEDYCGKILTIDPGKSTSLHFHSNKHETFYLLEGSLELTIVDTENCEESLICLEPGDIYTINRNVPHRLESSIGCKIIEVSTFHEDNDSYRIKK